MKLSEFTQILWRLISKEEFDLEKKVLKASVYIQLQSKNKKICIHKWEYEAKKGGK